MFCRARMREGDAARLWPMRHQVKLVPRHTRRWAAAAVPPFWVAGVRSVEGDALRQRQLARVVHGIGLATHVALPGIRA